MMTMVAIHQPNFFPWLGYFDKVGRADVFVFLDDVTYPRSGSGMGTWTNRVRINVQGEPCWVGCPLRRYRGSLPIREVRIDDNQPWRKKLLRTLEMNYKHSPNYLAAMGMLRPLIEHQEDNLASFNIRAIQTIADALGLKTQFVRQSDLGVSGNATELLINLAKAVGANAYLCGGGAAGYQQDDLFPQHGIQLVYQAFKPTPYGDSSRFLPNLSVIDFLFCGSRSHLSAFPGG